MLHGGERVLLARGLIIGGGLGVALGVLLGDAGLAAAGMLGVGLGVGLAGVVRAVRDVGGEQENGDQEKERPRRGSRRPLRRRR